jgi:hypothetical protein
MAAADIPGELLDQIFDVPGGAVCGTPLRIIQNIDYAIYVT